MSNLDMPLKIFELGCGNTKKTQIFLDEILRHESSIEYSPNDVSEGNYKTKTNCLWTYCSFGILYNVGAL